MSIPSSACVRTLAGLCIGFAALSPRALHAQCPPTFTATSWGMSGTPTMAVIGDFNNDGKLDMASPNFSGSNVTVRFANSSQPAGTNYNSSIALSLGINVGAGAAADVNNDGIDDLVVAYLGGSAPRIGVFISNGNGTFQPLVSYIPGPTTTQIKAADITRDGIDDIIVYAPNALYVLPGRSGAWLGGGAESFSVRSVTTAPGSNWTMIDTNSDGVLDLVSTGGDPGRVLLALGNAPASETFGAAVTYGSGSVFGTGWPMPGDFNGDGRQDLIVSHQITNARLQVFLSNPDGSLVAQPLVVTGGSSPRSPVVADFNGDGLLDAASTHSGGVGVHLGNGAGGLSSPTNFTVSSLTGLATADMNNDGKPDLIASSQTTGQFTILLNTTPVTAFNPVPFSQQTCPGGASTVQFFAAATTTQSGGITGYSWQGLIGGVWTNLTNGQLANVGLISGATTQQLTIANVQGVAGDRVISVRAVANTSCGGNPSAPAHLDLIEPCGPADLGGAGGVPTPCGGDGVLDNNDFIVFITYFFEANMTADFGVAAGFPGQDGVLDNNDFVAFIDAFFAGCL